MRYFVWKQRKMFNRFSLFILIIVMGCANRGTPTGGEIDTEPPSVLKASPENFSTNFNSTEIEILFDEYIRLSKLQTELIISPPINPLPTIMPMGSADKVLNISGLDSLIENTTYSFQFGESIEDNNERNPLTNYRYVFSTGDYIDSLKIKGSVKDAFDREISENINVLLYEIDSLFNDSIVYKQKPKYVGKVIDSTATYSIQNIKQGKYLLIALEEENKDYTFQSSNDKIGFYENLINLPEDSIIDLSIFKEIPNFKLAKPRQKSNTSFAFGFTGELEPLEINIINLDSVNYTSRITREKKSDSLIYWLKTNQKLDSIIFNVYNEKISDTFKLNLKTKEKDSLVIKPEQSKTLKFNDNFLLKANLPFSELEKNKISIVNKDSLNIEFETKLDLIKNQYSIIFEKAEEEEYTIRLLPGAITDLFENENDTLLYKLKTRKFDDYGNLDLNLINAKFPIIVQLVLSSGEVKYEKYETKNSKVNFENIDPGKYYIKIIYDQNEDKKFSTGNYLKKIFPEKVIYYPDEIDVRAGWDLIQEFILK
jgi:uncharacterized protein (DUF2141 family)